MKDKLIQEFMARYGGDNESLLCFFAPGRVNLIGEHIDYNGGYVLPCALDFGTYAIVRKRDDNLVKMATLNFDLRVTLNINDITYQEEHGWTNYSKGVIKAFQDKGHIIGGYEVLYYGNIPNSSGLSSSASLEVLTAVIINALYNCKETMIDMVKLSQKAENEFVGVNCGIMDQFVVGMGKKEHAILLDCNTLDYQYVPLELGDYKLVIANTRKRRDLADSKYNERRNECERALADLNKKLNITNLCELNEEVFNQNESLIHNPVIRKRAKHVVCENDRVKAAVSILNKGELKAFGQLMIASHNSLRDLYEVTGDALDIMVEEALKIEGVIGSRMTGAGFGGCTVSLVKASVIDTFTKEVGKAYKERTGLEGEFYIAGVGHGAGRF